MINFKSEEFDCKETGDNFMMPEFLDKIDNLRTECGFPFIITSGFRSPLHSIEKAKAKPGMHALGMACDVSITNSVDRLSIVSKALAMGFTGIGIDKEFIHLDLRSSTPVMWTY